MGQIAAEELLKRVKDRDSGGMLSAKYELLFRQSTTALAAGLPT